MFARRVPRFPLSFSLLFTVLFLSRAHGQELPAATDRWNRAALEWIHLLRSGSFEEAGSRVDPAVPPGAMGPQELETLWGQISAQLGILQSVGPGTVTENGPYHAADLPATFQNQAVTLRVVLTDSLQISGFFIRPPEPPAYEAPAYVDEGTFEEVEVTVGAEGWPLPGTLTLPHASKEVPAVVLVHGSGPNDRDETVGANRPFRDLAWGLASRGIAVLRYDKRTKVHPTRVPSDIGLDEEVVADALSALDWVRSHEAVDSDGVFLLGHSLGGILAPEMGRRDGNLAGIAILGASARPFFDVLRGQLEYIAGLAADPDSPDRAQIDSLLSLVAGVESGETPDHIVVLGAPPPYWREVAALDPLAVAGEMDTPMFVLQGGRDYQATSEDLLLWQDRLEGKGNVRTKLYPDLNHLFIPGTGMATPEEYATSRGHVSEMVIRDLAEWILHGGQ